MGTATDRNLTVRLPVPLLQRLKEEAVGEGMSMNAYLERLLEQALCRDRDEARSAAAQRLIARSKRGLYEMERPLSREQAHSRRG